MKSGGKNFLMLTIW